MVSSLDSVLAILYSFIQYLALLALILYNRTTVLLTPEKINSQASVQVSRVKERGYRADFSI